MLFLHLKKVYIVFNLMRMKIIKNNEEIIYENNKKTKEKVENI